MFVQEGEKITLLKGFYPTYDKFGGWDAGDKLTVRWCSEVEPRVDRNNKLGIYLSFEEKRGRYWLPIDWFKCRESTLKELLDE